MTIGDILDVAALLALRVDTTTPYRGESPREDVRSTCDTLHKLIEHWKWSLAVEGRSDSRRHVSAGGDQPRQLRVKRQPEIDRDHVRDQADVVTEVLATELLVRVYSVLLIARGSTARDAVLAGWLDQLSRGMNEMGQHARQHFILMHSDFSWSIKLYRLQKRLDRWSDILLAPTLMTSRLDRFWISRANIEDWTNHPWQRMADRDVAESLLRRAIQSAVPTEAVVAASRVRLVEQLLSSMLMLVPDDDFTADGVLMSLAQSRAANFSLDTPLTFQRPRY